MIKVIICGAGQVGSTIGEYLSAEDAHVTLVDHNEELIRRVNDNMDVRAIHGHAAHPEVIKQAGGKDADMLIAVTNSDEVNMVACQVAHTLFDVRTKIARLRHRNYLDPQWGDLFSRNHMPIDVIISPESEVARAIVNRLQVPGAADVIPLSHGLIHLLGIQCEEGNPVVGMTVGEITREFSDIYLNIIAVKRDGQGYLAKDDFELRVDDTAYVLIPTDQIGRLMVTFGHHEEEAHRLIIAGGNKIGRQLAQLVEDIPDVKSKIIENDPARARAAAIALPNTTVLQGDILNAVLLDELGINYAETFVAVTDDDEYNVMASLLAKKHNCPRVVTMLNTATYESLTTQLGIDVVINPRAMTVSSILQHVRRGRVRSVYSFGDDLGEIMEADALKGSVLVGKTIADLKLPKQATIAALVRNKAIIFPTPETTIEAYDRVITYASQKAIKKLEKLFYQR